VIGHEFSGLLISQIGSGCKKKPDRRKPQPGEVSMLSASGGPANGRNHAPIWWVMQHCGHTHAVGKATLWPSRNTANGNARPQPRAEIS
jgi:hypothetical protein